MESIPPLLIIPLAFVFIVIFIILIIVLIRWEKKSSFTGGIDLFQEEDNGLRFDKIYVEPIYNKIDFPNFYQTS